MINTIREILGLCVHDWTKWDYGTEKWSGQSYIDPNYEHTFIKPTQDRKCKKCGKYVKEYIK